MKISTKGRYSLRMLLDLAEHANDGFIALKDIAQRQGISKKYLEQIVPILNKTDILKTNRGFQGGYMLAKTPDKYTIGMISAGSRLMVLQSLMWSTPRPEAAIRMPPTNETSQISSSEMNVLDSSAMP